MRVPRLLTGTAIVAVLSGTAACGLQSVEPKLELRDAAKAFTSAGAGAMRFSIGSSAADVRAFGNQADKESADSSDTSSSASPSDADLTKLVSSRIDVSYDSGADQKSPTDDSSLALVHVGDIDAGEIRAVDQTLYARVNVPGLVTEFPDMKSDVDSFRASLTGGPDSADGAAPEAIRAPATAALDGRWLSLDMHADSWAEKQLKTASGGGLTADAPTKLKNLAGKAFGGGAVAVQRLDSDDKLGDHLVATTNLRKVYGNVRGDLASLFTGSAGTEIGKQLPAVTDVPDRNMTVSFWVKDDALTRVELDAAQFLDKPAGHLVLRVDALSHEKITAPAGAVAVDPKAIADQTGMPIEQLLAGGAAAGGTAAAGPDGPLDAHTVATYVDQDIRDMAEQDGVAPSVRYLSQARQDMLDMDSGIVLTRVGKRIQVAFGGHTACLKLSVATTKDGTITPGRC